MTAYEAHKLRWGGGCGNDICGRACKKVFAKADALPCDVLFIGEAPGDSENVLGKPFMGPAGHILDRIIDGSGARRYKLGYTNVVACFPTDEDGNKKGEPEKDEVKACLPRLVEFVRIAKPRIIILVGKIAARYVRGQSMFAPVDWLPPGEFIRFAEILHPAAILKGSIANRGFEIQRNTIRLAEALESGPCVEAPRAESVTTDEDIPF